jgi:4-carboxymuconolactone decarboxylase
MGRPAHVRREEYETEEGCLLGVGVRRARAGSSSRGRRPTSTAKRGSVSVKGGQRSKEPKIPPVSPDGADPLTSQTFEVLSGFAAPSNVVLGTLMWHRELTELYMPFSDYVKNDGYIAGRYRELAILRTAWNCGADYQWVAHTKCALSLGLTPEEVNRVAIGPSDANWDEVDRNLLCAVDELHGQCRIDDRTWDALSSTFDQRQMIELLMLVGNYQMVAMVMNSVGIAAPGAIPDLPGNSFRAHNGRVEYEQ